MLLGYGHQCAAETVESLEAEQRKSFFYGTCQGDCFSRFAVTFVNHSLTYVGSSGARLWGGVYAPKPGLTRTSRRLRIGVADALPWSSLFSSRHFALSSLASSCSFFTATRSQKRVSKFNIHQQQDAFPIWVWYVNKM